MKQGLSRIKEVTTTYGIMNITNYKWKTKEDLFLKPSEMETRHLFFTLRMIFNNSVPEKYRHKPIRRYQFGSFYSNDYMVLSIRAILIELGRRTDLTPYFKKSLQFIKKSIEELFEIKKIEKEKKENEY